MKLIAGLGNPGEKFKNSRHNVGFMVVDAFARQVELSWRYSADLMCYFVKGGNYVLCKPAIYMNKSGEAIRALGAFYKISPKEILIVHDDLDLDFGKVRLSFNGISAGHHGVESTIESLGSMDFGRLRVGIGHPRYKGDTAVVEYVLADFSAEETKTLETIFKKSQEAVQSFIDEGIEATMNRFN